MYRKIMVPVDLQMQPMVANALKVATDLAGLYGADITLVSVSPGVTDTGTPTPDQAGADLKEMAAAMRKKAA